MTKRYVGVLLNGRLYRGIRAGNTGHEALINYLAAADLYGITPCFVRLKDLRPGAKTTTGYVWRDSGFVRVRLPVPKVIHNRAIFKKKRQNQKIARLAAKGIHIYNGRNRYGKVHIHQLLMGDVPLRIHLPETMEATPINIRAMMERHGELILKPNSGSIGQGVMLLKKTGNRNWQLELAGRDGKPEVHGIDLSKPLPGILREHIYARRYLVQQRLPLATWEGRPFDIRVSVQRGYGGDWQITGMVGKVAAEKSYLTNVARGGMVMPLDRLLAKFPSLDPEEVRENISRFALLVARCLSGSLPRMADLGLDVGITEAGFPMFIECNGRDLRYSFLRGGLVREWIRTYVNPMGYGAYLLEARSRRRAAKAPASSGSGRRQVDKSQTGEQDGDGNGAVRKTV